jgi:hypothetical protein
MSKNINDYKSEMQNVKFSPDFVSKTIASLNEMKTDVTEIITPRQSQARFSIIRNVSLALAACFLCVFTVRILMREENTAENLQTVELPTVTTIIQETSPEMIEEIAEFTPFAALPELTEAAPLLEPEITEAAAESSAVKETTITVTEAAVTMVTEAAVTTPAVTEAETTAAYTRIAPDNDTVADDSAEEAAADAAEDADAEEDEGGTGSTASISSSGDDSLTEEDAFIEEDAEESALISADEAVLTGNEVMIDNSLSFDSFTAYEMMSIENYNALLRYKDDTAVFLTNNQTTALAGNAALIISETLEKNSIVFVNSAEIEFHLSITDQTKVKYVIYLFTDALAIAVYDSDGNYTLSAVTLTSADHTKLFAEMYTDLFSEAGYELYLARESGK